MWINILVVLGLIAIMLPFLAIILGGVSEHMKDKKRYEQSRKQYDEINRLCEMKKKEKYEEKKRRKLNQLFQNTVKKAACNVTGGELDTHPGVINLKEVLYEKDFTVEGVKWDKQFGDIEKQLNIECEHNSGSITTEDEDYQYVLKTDSYEEKLKEISEAEVFKHGVEVHVRYSKDIAEDTKWVYKNIKSILYMIDKTLSKKDYQKMQDKYIEMFDKVSEYIEVDTDENKDGVVVGALKKLYNDLMVIEKVEQNELLSKKEKLEKEIRDMMHEINGEDWITGEFTFNQMYNLDEDIQNFIKSFSKGENKK